MPITRQKNTTMPTARNSDRPLVSMMDGVKRRTMLWGNSMLLAEIFIEEGGVARQRWSPDRDDYKD